MHFKYHQPLEEGFSALTLEGISSSDEGGECPSCGTSGGLLLSGGGSVSSVADSMESNLF